MGYSHEEIEILILENALDSAKLTTARLKRRIYRAEMEYAEALDTEKGLKETISLMRDSYLRRTV